MRTVTAAQGLFARAPGVLPAGRQEEGSPCQTGMSSVVWPGGAPRGRRDGGVRPVPNSASARCETPDVSRHVAHAEAHGPPTPARVHRQRRILAALSAHYAALSRSAGGAPSSRLRPIASFGFSMRTPPEEAVAKLVTLLDEVDPQWRAFVKVWDGVRGGLDNAVRA